MQFLHQFNQERSNAAHTVRIYAAQIFSLKMQFFMKNFDCSNVPKLRALLEDPSKPDEKYPLLAPFLFPNNDVSSNHPFKAVPLIMVCIETPVSSVTSTKLVLLI